MDQWQRDDDGARLQSWLCEVAEAMDEAQRAISLIGLARGPSAATRDLYDRIALARVQIEQLRQVASTPKRALPPNWIKFVLESVEPLPRTCR